MWCDIYLIVFSFERGDLSMFYATPQGKGMSVQEILNAEDSFIAKYGYHRSLVKFEMLNEMLVEEADIGRVLDRDSIKSIMKKTGCTA